MRLLGGPQVAISVGPTGGVYHVSRDLLSARSSYFAAMFQENSFKEGIEKVAVLEEMEGVVSSRSLDSLLQWIYRDNASFESTELPDIISEMLEFLRMADMCDVHGMEKPVTRYILAALKKADFSQRSKILLPHHISSTGRLPVGHPLRSVIAKAIMRPFFEEGDFPFFDELSQVPSLSGDFLKEVRAMIHHSHPVAKKIPFQILHVKYQDPLSNNSRDIVVKHQGWMWDGSDLLQI